MPCRNYASPAEQERKKPSRNRHNSGRKDIKPAGESKSQQDEKISGRKGENLAGKQQKLKNKKLRNAEFLALCKSFDLCFDSFFGLRFGFLFLPIITLIAHKAVFVFPENVFTTSAYLVCHLF